MKQLKQAHQGVVGGRNLCLLFLGINAYSTVVVAY
jgi:hypothetical protein